MYRMPLYTSYYLLNQRCSILVDNTSRNFMPIKIKYGIGYLNNILDIHGVSPRFWASSSVIVFISCLQLRNSLQFLLQWKRFTLLFTYIYLFRFVFYDGFLFCSQIVFYGEKYFRIIRFGQIIASRFQKFAGTVTDAECKLQSLIQTKFIIVRTD